MSRITNDAKIRSMSQRWAEATGQEEPFMHVSRPGDGSSRYVFQNKTCLSFPEAERYMLRLLDEAQPKETA